MTNEEFAEYMRVLMRVEADIENDVSFKTPDMTSLQLQALNNFAKELDEEIMARA